MLRRATTPLLRLSRTSRVALVAPGLQRRLLTSSSTLHTSKEPPMEDDQPVSRSTDEEDVPWYLRTDESSKLNTPIFKAEMPQLPTNPPATLEPLIRSLIDLGLDELRVFDLRGRDEEIPMAQHVDFAVVCQGKSPKHLQNAAEQLMTQLKREHDVLPHVEGLVKPNSTMRMKRRLKQKKPVNDFGLGVNSWIMVDTQLDCYVNMLTPERREQVNLEYLWCKPEEKTMYEPKQTTISLQEDSIFASLFRRSYSTATESLPLEIKAVQCFQLGDIKTFDSEVVPQIQHDQDKALSVLDTIIANFKKSDIEAVISGTEEETQQRARNYFKIINSCLPSTPTATHWSRRFEALDLLSTVFPTEIRSKHLRDSLLLQASSGVSITEPQLLQFLNSLSKDLYFNPPSHVLTPSEIDTNARAKLRHFSYVFEAMTAEQRGEVSDEVVLAVLKLATQQHLYGRSEDVLPVSAVFDVLLEVFAKRTPSLGVMEFVLVTYLKANATDKFWRFWDSLRVYRFSSEKGVALLDSRPWSLLLQLLVENDHQKLTEQLLNRHLNEALDLGLEFSEQMKRDVMTLVDRFDESGKAFKELRERFQ